MIEWIEQVLMKGLILLPKTNSVKSIEFLILYVKVLKDCNEAGIKGSHHVSKIEDT
jgi:hypothetical protein